MSSLRPESHVAQQIRREKLRIQNSTTQHSQEFPNNVEQLSLHPGFNNLDLVQVRSVRNANMLDEPQVYSSEMMQSFSTASNPLSSAPPRNGLEYLHHLELGSGAEPSNRLMMNLCGSFPHSMSSDTHSSQKEQCELRNLGNWRNSAATATPHQGSDWFVNYADNANSFYSAELNNNVPVPAAYNELMDAQCSNNASSVEVVGREITQNQKQLSVLHNPPPSSSPSPLFHNALQDIVKSASIRAHKQDMTSLMQQNENGIWVGNVAEAEVQHGFENQPNHQLRYGWTDRTIAGNTMMNDSNPQSLSLSLASNAQSKHSEGSASDDLQSGYGILKYHPQCLKSIVKPSIVSRDYGKSIQEMLPSKGIISYRNVGPLGPFTGYATILKGSRFLKSAQQLLDEICCPKYGKSCDVLERVLSPEVSASTSADDTVTVNGTVVAAKGSSNSGSSSSMLYNVPKENSVDHGVGSSIGLPSRPDYQQKKAKLLYMQEEVIRQCKQYNQQMQMVVSSFESVAGLSSATPYISLALKSVSKHFRCLKNAISEQLKLISQVLGEESSIPSTSTGNKGGTNIGRLRCMDQSFQRNKSGSSRGTTDLIESHHHVWRPQRGLPERAVAILKTWLFEHFLHPYPTDTDKHMLASQTGLSRNQVSNWFINARVRVWKPMVEEIHMLETKATGSSKNEGTCGTMGVGTSQARVENPLSKYGVNSIPENQFQSMEMGSSMADEESGLNTERYWSQEKRSKLECHMSSSNSDGAAFMGFVPYRSDGGIEVGGLGSVSLTLGLRHGVEGVQHQQQLQEEQLRRHLGGHMIHDFVG